MSAAGPDAKARLDRAAKLQALGRYPEAQQECVAALKEEPRNVEALLRYALIMHDLDRRNAAIATYREALAVDPRNLIALVNLGDLLWRDEDPAGARPHFEAALAVDPDCARAHEGLAKVLVDLRDPAGAEEHVRKAFPRNQVARRPYHGQGPAVEVLVLCAWQRGNTPLDHAIDPGVFLQKKLNVEFYDLGRPLPAHRVAWNAIGDVELCAPSLDRCERLLKATRAPVLNPPSRIRPTGRADNARRLAGIPGLIAPRIMNFTREELQGPGGPAGLEKAGFAFPLLIRAPGFQGGRHFEKVAAPRDLAGALEAMPGRDFVVIEFVDTAGEDGKYRKYRAMMIDQRLHPLHAAVSADWKIHFFSAGMTDNPAHRAEDEAYLNGMEGVLGPRALGALEGVRKTLNLDYGGIDFGLTRSGEAVLFESNATMVIPRPDSSQVWDYRRRPVQRLYDAVTAMLLRRAGLPQRQPPPGGRPALAPLAAAVPLGPGRGSAGFVGPSPLDLRLARASGMHKFGLTKEAKLEYAAVLAENPDHIGALMAYGALMHETDRTAAAIEVFARVASLRPDHAEAFANLGTALFASNRREEARRAFEAALALEPELPAAHQGMAQLLAETRDLEAIRRHGRKAYAGRSYYELPFRGTGSPPRVLVLYSALGGNIPLTRTVDNRGFRHIALIPEYHEAGERLPEHDVVFNAIGDADIAGDALARAGELLAGVPSPVLNPPAKVAPTGRSENARRLAGIPGLRVPAMADFARRDLEHPEAAARLEARGFGFPLLLRAQGFHAGKHFEKLDSARDLGPALRDMPGDAFTVIQFLDARSPDGKTRKYRVMGIGGRLYPLHAAVSAHWKIHYYTADMQGNAGHRAEDEAFLRDMAGALGPGPLAAIQAVQARLDLDYMGMDFSVNQAGEAVLYEANATMVLVRPKEGPQWDYRRAPVEAAVEAVNDLLRSRLPKRH